MSSFHISTSALIFIAVRVCVYSVLVESMLCCLLAPPARSEAVLQAGAVTSVSSQGFRGEGATFT